MKRFIVAITRTCGSGATSIGELLSKEYGIEIYDKNILRMASDDSGINEQLFAMADENVKKSLLYKISKKVYKGELIPPESDDFTRNDNLFNYQAKVLKELAEQESYVCIGRACDYVLRDNPNAVKIFLYAPFEVCVAKEMKRLGIGQKEAEKHVSNTDKHRREYHKYHTGRTWGDPYNYDMCLDTSKFESYQDCVDYIKFYLDKRFAD